MKFLARLAPFALFVPVFAFAAAADASYLTGLITQLNNIVKAAVPFIFALAFLAFVWGMFKAFILGGADEEKQTEGKQLMIYAIVGFVVMVALWGIVNLVISLFGISASDTVSIPKIPQTTTTN